MLAQMSILSNLENSKSTGLEVLFEITCSPNYRVVDIMPSRLIGISFFLPNICFWREKRLFSDFIVSEN